MAQSSMPLLFVFIVLLFSKAIDVRGYLRKANTKHVMSRTAIE